MKRLSDFKNGLTENANSGEPRQIMDLHKDVTEISELYKQAGKSLYVNTMDLSVVFGGELSD
jgi:hypothetical protein